MLLMIENAVGEGFRTLGIGILIVVGVLALLMAVLYLLIPLFSKIANKQPKKKSGKTIVPAPAAPAPVTAPDSDDDGDVAAAIIAAISAESGRAPASLRVVSFKRIK